jgi:hypothetical protein
MLADINNLKLFFFFPNLFKPLEAETGQQTDGHKLYLHITVLYTYFMTSLTCSLL